MDAKQAQKTKRACYFTNLVMASAFGLPPLLFAAFHELYGISYTLLGTLVLVNFCTQLSVDLLFSFFSKYFNVHKTIRAMPLVTAFGLAIYALIPLLFPQYAYVGLVSGTVVFSLAAGLGEVLVSPTIAALPSDTPDKDMSALHSLYGYGFVGVVLVSTLYIQFVGKEYWYYLVFFLAALPVVAFGLLSACRLPDMDNGGSKEGAERSGRRTAGMILCVFCIFFGACAENTMSNWISAFAENALHIPKIWGDVFGMAAFAALLALTRTAYSKFGKNIYAVLLCSMIGSAACYLLVAFSPSAVLSLAGCVALGICTAMLWPGTLIFMEENISGAGVASYALMAAGGDFGASVAPQTLGAVVDRVAVSDFAASVAENFAITAEQVGFKVGMLISAVFPFLGVFLLLFMRGFFAKSRRIKLLDAEIGEK